MTGKQRARLSRALHDKAVTGMAVGSWVPSAVLALALVVLAPSIDVTQNPMQAVPFLAQCSSQPYLDDDGSTIRLGNDSLEIRFSKEAKGAIVGVENKVTGQQLVTNPAEALATWLIWDADDRWYGIWLAGSFSYEWKRMEDCSIELDLAWHNMDGAASSMVVHGRVILGESNLSRWRLSYEGAPGTFAPKAIAFPSVRGILPIGVSPRDDRYLVPETSGRLVHNPYEAMKGHGGYGVAGPGNTLNLQFVSLYEVDKGGFYLATEDTQGFRKVFDLYNEDQVFTLSIFHYPSISSRGSYEVPYDTVVGTFRGDSWCDAAKIYRRWALEQPWVQHGPLSERQDVPGWWKDLYGVLRLEFAQGSTQRTIERALRLASSLQAAAGSREMLFFVWGWEKGGVFRDQPVWFPPGIGEERFADFVSNAHDVGARVIPYFTPNTVDVTTQAYEEDWIDAQVVDQWGARVDWRLQGTGGEVNWTWICPAVEGWKDYNVEQIDELVDRYDVDGVYLDILSASPPMECYDESHGHPLGGGAWWTSHSLETADLLRQAGREHDPGFVAFGEMFNEHFISHLDGFWDLSVNNYLQDWWWHVNTYGAETVPLFEFVYHPYTRIITGDWPAPYREWGQWYYYTMGYWFVSGGAVGVAISERAPEPAMWDFTTVMMEASSGYAKDFLVFGQMIEPPALDVPTVRLTQDDVPSYKQLHVRDGTLEVPSVLNSAWRAPDGSVGHVLANILPNQVPVKITLDSCGLDAKSYGIYAYRNGEYVVEETNVALPHEVHMDLRPHEIVVIGIVEGPISEPSPTATATRPPTPTLTTVPSPTSTTVPLPTYTATARPSPTCTTTMVSKPTSTSAVAPTPSWPVTLAPTTDIGRASQGDDGAEGASLTLGSPGDQDRLSVVLSIVGAAVVLIVVGWLLYARRLRIRHGRE